MTAGTMPLVGIVGNTVFVVGGWELKGNATLLLRSRPLFGVLDCTDAVTAS
jgi:hypothetical protein